MQHPEYPRLVNEALPLRPPDYFILFVLLEGARHGYGMAKAIEELTAGQIRLEAGNLYRYLRRMIKDGWIRPSERRPAKDSDDERRRYYAITKLGRRIVHAEVARMRSVVTLAKVHGIPKAGG